MTSHRQWMVNAIVDAIKANDLDAPTEAEQWQTLLATFDVAGAAFAQAHDMPERGEEFGKAAWDLLRGIVTVLRAPPPQRVVAAPLPKADEPVMKEYRERLLSALREVLEREGGASQAHLENQMAALAECMRDVAAKLYRVDRASTFAGGRLLAPPNPHRN